MHSTATLSSAGLRMTWYKCDYGHEVTTRASYPDLHPFVFLGSLPAPEGSERTAGLADVVRVSQDLGLYDD